MNTGLLYVSYNIAWVTHIAHSIDWIFSFYHERRTFSQIWQGYRKFYRYLLADQTDERVIRFTWKTFVAWEIMFYITSAMLILKSHTDRSKVMNPSNYTMPVNVVDYEHYVPPTRPILATFDQLEIVQENTSVEAQNIIFWVHLFFNIICLNIVFLSEVFFMMMVSIVYHAFAFLHKQIDEQLGNPDSIFNIQCKIFDNILKEICLIDLKIW